MPFIDTAVANCHFCHCMHCFEFCCNKEGWIRNEGSNSDMSVFGAFLHILLREGSDRGICASALPLKKK